jgi:putative membrane protein
MDYLYLKALHIISVICWFAGLFYLVRLFIYHTESRAKPEPLKQAFHDQFTVMERRLLYGITTPAMLATWVFGLAMIATNPSVMQAPWIHFKLLLVVLLSGYSGFCSALYKKLRDGKSTYSSGKLRILNEVPTFFLVAVVLLAVLKDIPYAMIGTGLFLVLLVVSFILIRKKSPQST